MFRVLIACEESQAVLKEVLKLGHDDIVAYSCDILPCSGGLEEYHIQSDVRQVLTYFKYDMVIAFPPCTHLAVSGARHFEKKREDGRQREAIEFFKFLYDLPCKYKMIENPVNIIGSDYIAKWFPELNTMRTANQYIQPYEYGDPYRKKTGIWLFNLPKLKPTNIVEPKLVYYTKKNGRLTSYSANMSSGFKQEERSKVRSKTYPGIAHAIATQLVEYAYNREVTT